MPSSSLALNTNSVSKLDLTTPSHAHQSKSWTLPALVTISFGFHLLALLFPNTIVATIASAICIAIAAICLAILIISFIALIAVIIELVMISLDKTNQEQPSPTYEENKQMDAEQLPTHEEAVGKEEQAKLGINRLQPISPEQTCLISEDSHPPCGAFFENPKPTSIPFQPDIEPTVRSAGLHTG